MKNFGTEDGLSPEKGEPGRPQVENFKLENILQKLPIGIAIVDPESGNFIFVNQNFAQILGYSVTELLGKPFQAITHPEDLGKNIELHDKLRRGEIGSYSIEKQNVRKDGSVVWVNLTAIRFRDNNNREFHLGAIFDLSARKLAEQQLAASEELLRKVITNAPVSIFATDENGVFTLHEGKAIERVGMKPGENVGASAYELFAGLKVTEHNGTIITGKTVLDRVFHGEYLSGLTKLNGVVFDNQFAPIIGQNGKIAGLLGVATDITDQKRMEQERLEFESRYRMLFTQIDEGFCIIEMIFDEKQKPVDYRFLETNPVFEKQTGLKDAQGKRILELVPALEKYWFEIYGRIALTGIAERFVKRAEQLHRWYDVYAFRFGQPEKRQVAVLFSDITQRKRTEDELHDREEKWRNLFQILPVGVSIVNTQNSTFEINDALAEILDIPKNDLINGAYRNRSYFRPDMTIMPPEEFPSLRAMNERKFIKDVEIGIKKEDGSMIWTNVSAAPLSSYQSCVTVTTDITKHKKTLQRIVESEYHLNEAERIGNSGSWDYDVASDMATWSNNMFRIFDVDPEMPQELVFENFVHNLVYPDDQEHVRSVFREALAGKRAYDLEYRIIRKDGTLRNVHAIAEIHFDETGRAVRMVGKVEDITERRKWEEELRYRAEVAAQISDGISLIRVEDGNLVHTSPRYEEMFGYQRGEMEGKHATILNASDPNRNATETHELIMAAVRKNGKWKGVVHNVKKDGTPFWTQASVSTIVHPKLGKVLLSVQMDVTERIEAEIALKKNEKLLTAMVSNISDVIAIVDENGITRYKSSNVEKWFGWKPQELIGQDTFENIHPNDREQLKNVLKFLLANPGETYNGEHRYRCKDNSYKWIEMTAVKPTDNLSIVGILINYRDISDRRKAREKLIAHEKELKLLSSELIVAQEQEKKALATELHDEIGQSLTAMKINLSTILKDIPAESTNPVCERIKETDELLDSIIARIHDISLDLRPAMLDILGFASTIKSYAQQFEKRTGVKVRMIDKCKSNLTTEQEINLFRIVQEALTNVAKHADAKNVEICLQSGRKWFELSVADDGKGIVAKPTDKTPENNLRIGLIGMNERVNALQGKFHITSGPQNGTKIELKVPLHGKEK